MHSATQQAGRSSLSSPRALAFALLIGLAVSVAGWQLRLNLAVASVLDVVLVVLLARKWGFFNAALASFVCFACLDYFFIAPVFSLTIADAQNWVTLGAFEVAALVVSGIAAEAEKQAKLAREKRRESEQLYEVSRGLLLLNRQQLPGPQITALLTRVCQPDAVAMFDAELARTDAAGRDDAKLKERTLEAYLTDRNLEDASPVARFRVLRFDARTKGALGLRGSAITDTLMNGLSTLAAIGLETQRSFESASRAVAERHTEQLRTAVLDALAHEFKTPLTTIQACSGGLLEAESLRAAQRELAEIIHDQAGQLERLTNSLLQTARLDSESMVLKRQLTKLTEIIERLVATATRSAREITISLNDRNAAVWADVDLLTLALSQILDNAIRYSSPDTPIAVSGSSNGTEALLIVTNAGNPIAAAERTRIFDRYYRAGGAANQVSGSGLGLSITKKIVEAHSGRVWVESNGIGTMFSVSLPLYREATDE